MDEPFSALDVHMRGALQDELLNLQKKYKKTIVFVTHDAREAVILATRIGILHKTKLAQIVDSKSFNQVTFESQLLQIFGSI